MVDRKTAFTVTGTVVREGNKKRIKINSPDHYEQEVQALPENQEIGITVAFYKASRSQAQLNYHWTLMGYLARETGYTKEEIHEVVMRQKFGTKLIKVGQVAQYVRRSVADGARFPKNDMVELINFDLELCAELNIHVPTKEELGYLPS